MVAGNIWTKGWSLLTAPPKSISEPGDRRRAQLLSASLLVLGFLVFLATIVHTLITFPGIPGDWVFQILLVVILLLGLAYWLSRTRYFLLGAALATTTATLAGLAIAVFGSEPNQEFVLEYLIVPVIFAGVFFRVRFIAGLVGAQLIAILALPLLKPGMSYRNIIEGPFIFNLIVSALLLLSRNFRAMAERDSQRRLSEKEELYRGLLETSFEGIAIHDNGIIIDANPGVARLLHCELSEIIGRSILDFVTAESREIILRNAEARVNYPFEVQTWGPDGSSRCVEVAVRRQMYEGRLVRVVALRDITERKQAEEALADEKEQLAVTLQSIGDGVITTDMQGRVLLLNTVAEKLTGWPREQAAGRPLPEVLHLINEDTGQLAENPVAKVLETGGPRGLENHTSLISKDGTHYILADSAAPIKNELTGEMSGVVMVFRDITEKLKTEQELQNLQKLESLGILAGGIAHDFNNILTAVGGNIGLAKLEAVKDGVSYELLDEAEKAVYRARSLTQQLLTFARGGAPAKRPASLKAVVEESAHFALRGAKARFVSHIPDNLWPVEIDVGQINQVISNLVINADQAMPGGGTITARAWNVPSGETGRPLPLKGRDYVKLLIADEGEGIPPALLNRIFDPYFTTKKTGSGLGLSISFSIISKHDGLITVDSEVGKGTHFYLYLPASPSRENLVAEQPGGKPMIKKIRILVVDDEQMIRDLLVRMLSNRGWEVMAVAEGGQAIERYREALESDTPFDLVIMDLTIAGGMGGKEAIAALKLIDPQVKAVVSSGYSVDPIVANPSRYGFRAVLVKPFQLKELYQVVEDLVQEPSPD